ncbi:adenosine deaminase 2 isoform X5 [Drosophila ananassae]|uniref:adenosine deaminase 2 isoform X5 n=1 Tax=Drosophila ananassae TaxID=7217 RepID=UPI0013A5E215|nr:adenosine deaminase 2 isoform X5 [Drosophila ananassae]XP_032309788.1 adenosine deaminase 2 isoform X5 [Drosophila ananassae]
MDDVFAYLPAFRRYIWQMLTELYLDNVMYAEIRSSLKQLYDEKGKTYPKEFTAREYIDINKKFVKKYPDFLGVKIIFCGHRRSFEKIRKSIQEFKQLHSKDFPDFIIGFDIVGQEDPGKTLYSVLDYLEDLPKTAKLFFHGGETNWSGGTRETNLLDAILLKTTRIGHGYALAKHPILLEKVINNTIALEVSPISNQVLNLVWDLRNHPAAIYLSQNIPMSITSDDPGFWGAKGLSYDFYYAIMSLAPNNAGLRLLKALVWHSIDYSILTSGEKQRGLDILDRRWNNFLTEAIKKWGKKKPNKNKQYGEDLN